MGGGVISIDRARCCWFRGFPKCILPRIGMIIRQLGGLIEESPRRQKWNHWKRLFSSWHRVWLTQVTLLSPRCFDWVGKWTRVLNKKINSKPRSLKAALFLVKGPISILSPAWYSLEVSSCSRIWAKLYLCRWESLPRLHMFRVLPSIYPPPL